RSCRERGIGGDKRAATTLPARKLRIGIEPSAQAERRGKVVIGRRRGADESHTGDTQNDLRERHGRPRNTLRRTRLRGAYGYRIVKIASGCAVIRMRRTGEY